jgi:hypothetical protein
MDAAKLPQLLATECPEFATATMLLRDRAGRVVGYGEVWRTETGVEVRVSSAPEGVRFLRSFQQSTGG